MVKNLPASAGDIRDAGLISGWGRSPGGGNGNLLHEQGRLVGSRPQGHKESDMTDWGHRHACAGKDDG